MAQFEELMRVNPGLEKSLNDYWRVKQIYYRNEKEKPWTETFFFIK